MRSEKLLIFYEQKRLYKIKKTVLVINDKRFYNCSIVIITLQIRVVVNTEKIYPKYW